MDKDSVKRFWAEHFEPRSSPPREVPVTIQRAHQVSVVVINAAAPVDVAAALRGLACKDPAAPA